MASAAPKTDIIAATASIDNHGSTQALRAFGRIRYAVHEMVAKGRGKVAAAGPDAPISTHPPAVPGTPQ